MLIKRQADKPLNCPKNASQMQAKNKRNAIKRRYIKLQQILKIDRQVKENATEGHFRHFRYGERKNRETRFSGGEQQ